MEVHRTAAAKNPSQKTQIWPVSSQVVIRLAAFGTSLCAALIMATNRETEMVFGIPMTAKYTYSNAFRFLVGANAAACAYSLLSLPFVLKFISQKKFLFVFLLDLIVTALLAAATSAATAIGFVAKYGNSHTGWIAICPFLRKFCDRATSSIACSFAAMTLFLLLTVLSAMKPRSSAVCW